MFSATIKMHRKRLGLTQVTVGALFPDACGKPLPRRTWQQWESGERTPPGWAQTLILRRLAGATLVGG